MISTQYKQEYKREK